jgi:hypothetical protein
VRGLCVTSWERGWLALELPDLCEWDDVPEMRKWVRMAIPGATGDREERLPEFEMGEWSLLDWELMGAWADVGDGTDPLAASNLGTGEGVWRTTTSPPGRRMRGVVDLGGDALVAWVRFACFFFRPNFKGLLAGKNFEKRNSSLMTLSTSAFAIFFCFGVVAFFSNHSLG